MLFTRLLVAVGFSMTALGGTLTLPMVGSKWGLYASGGVIKCGVSVCGSKQYPGTLPNGGGIYFDFPVAPDLPVGAYVTSTGFNGTGLDDATWNECPDITAAASFCAAINGVNAYNDAAGWHDSISWGTDVGCANGGTVYLQSTSWIWLAGGNVWIKFDSMSGHTLGDKWSVSYAYGTQPTDWRGYLMAVPTVKSFTNASVLTMTVEVITTGDPVFGHNGDGEGDCGIPVSIRPHFQKGAWDKWVDDSYRWWAKDPYRFVLTNGTATISIPLTPDKWVQTWGKSGDATPTLTQAFNQSIASIGAIGTAIGGGCSYGHGANINQGTARLVLKSYSVN